ncbi:MAG: hypothetical protein H7326_05945 [Bdellovibrionaceae bacterium]|nr:hypothetical protein [Pseudobdellovibrionaceae bacterium]
MSDKTVQFGPFTPQELDSLVRVLQLKNLPFEIQKEDDTEKKFKAIDFANIVKQVEFRTEQYLAQIFYITLARKDLPQISGQLEKLGFPTDLPEGTQELQTTDAEEVFVRARAEKKNFDRRLIALIMVVGLLCLLFVSAASIFSN